MQTSEETIDTEHKPTLTAFQSLAQARFYASDRCKDARVLLQALVDNQDYDTDADRYTDGTTFCEWHLNNLSRYPNMELNGYLSNLRLMTRKRKNYKG